MSGLATTAAVATEEVLSLRDRVAHLERALQGERDLHDDTMEKWKQTIHAYEVLKAGLSGTAPEAARIAIERNALNVAVALKEQRIAELERRVADLLAENEWLGGRARRSA